MFRAILCSRCAFGTVVHYWRVRYCCVVCGAYWWHWVVVSLCGTVGSCSVQSSRFCDGQGMDRRQTRRAQTVTAGWTGPVILLKAQTVFLHCVFSTGVVFSLTFHHCGFSMCYCWMNRTGHIAQGSNYLLAVCNRKPNQKNHFVFWIEIYQIEFWLISQALLKYPEKLKMLKKGKRRTYI